MHSFWELWVYAGMAIAVVLLGFFFLVSLIFMWKAPNPRGIDSITQ